MTRSVEVGKSAKDLALELAPKATAVKRAAGHWEIVDGETVLGNGQNPVVAWGHALFTLEQRK